MRRAIALWKAVLLRNLTADRASGVWAGDSIAELALYNLVIGHAVSHAGESAVLKGVQGLKGHPFWFSFTTAPCVESYATREEVRRYGNGGSLESPGG